MLLLAALAQSCCWQHWLNVVAGSIGSMLLLAALAHCCCGMIVKVTACSFKTLVAQQPLEQKEHQILVDSIHYQVFFL